VSGWRLSLRQPTSLPLDLSPLLPERLAGMAEREVAAIGLRHGNRAVPLGELFALAAAPDDLILEGTTAACERIGRAMSGGRLRVDGDAGAFLAQDMRAGEIELAGTAGPYAASGMKDGLLRIRGDAGEHLGGALPGDPRGMQGGAVFVDGAAGGRLGDRMRRGVIVVGGAAGEHAGSRMIGGTIIVRGGCGAEPGYAMRRGSLILASPPSRLLCTFADNGIGAQGWTALLRRHLQDLGWRGGLPGPRFRRFTGCASTAGAGEILIEAAM
jgi:formylmethanofuran dehydrogenase subunit C